MYWEQVKKNEGGKESRKGEREGWNKMGKKVKGKDDKL